MPENGKQAELDRESFARAWASGDAMEQGRMIHDLHCHGVEAKQIVRKHLAYIYGGLTVVSLLATALLKQAGLF